MPKLKNEFLVRRADCYRVTAYNQMEADMIVDIYVAGAPSFIFGRPSRITRVDLIWKDAKPVRLYKDGRSPNLAGKIEYGQSSKN